MAVTEGLTFDRLVDLGGRIAAATLAQDGEAWRAFDAWRANVRAAMRQRNEMMHAAWLFPDDGTYRALVRLEERPVTPEGVRELARTLNDAAMEAFTVVPGEVAIERRFGPRQV